MSDTTTVTVLMTDLVDSTRLLQHGPEVAEELRREHMAALRSAVARHRGVEVKSTGDGLMVTFASAADAVSAAEAIQQSVHQLCRGDARHAAVRVGLSAGEATFEDGDWYGTPVIEAARLVAPDQSQGGEVLATAVVPLIVGRRGAHEFTALGGRFLKGFEEPVDVVRLEWRPFVPPPAVPLPPAVSLSGGGFFVGRDAEGGALRAAWERAASGQKQVVLVAGEPGIGKTRLVAELARAAHADGALVLWGRCDEELALPFQPFVEAMRSWLSHSEEDLVRLASGELARLLPELKALVPGLAPTASDADTERLLLYQSVAGLLAARSASTPIVLVLDDLHWAGAPTLYLLRHIARDSAPAALLIVGTYRDTELGRSHPLADVLADLRREPVVERIALRGLDQIAVSAYVEAAAGERIGDAGEALARMMHAETEGNPFFIGQVLRHLTETGSLTRSEDGWTLARSLDELGLPEGIREVVGRRLSRLPGETDRLLAVAAVIGPEFDISVLERIEDSADPSLILDSLDAAVSARLIDEAPGRPGRFVFGHALVRQTLLSDLTAARRARLHRRVAETLAVGADPDAVALANHYCAGATAGTIQDAVDWSHRAAAQLADQLAFEECAVVLERALHVVDLADSVDPGIRARISLGIAQAVNTFASTEVAKRWAAEAAADARRAGDVALLAEAARMRTSWGLAGIPDPLARELLEEVLAKLGPHDVALRARMLALLAFYRAVNDSEGLAVEPLMREAIDLARVAGDKDTLAGAIANWMVTIVSHPNLDEQEALLAEFDTAQATVRGDMSHFVRRITMARVRVVVGLQRGDLAASIAAFSDAEAAERERAERQNWQPFAIRFVTMWRAMYALLAGRLDDADESNTALAEQAQGDPNFLNSWGAQLLRIRREQGRVSELVPVLESMVEQTPGLIALRCLLALALTDTGRLDAARTQFVDVVAEDLARVPKDATWSSSLADLTEVCFALQDRAAARALQRELEAFEGQVLVIAWGVACLGAADAYLGLLDAVLGNHVRAEERFGRAIALEEGLESMRLAGRTRAWRDRARQLRQDDG